MNRITKKYGFLAAAAACFALLLGSCDKRDNMIGPDDVQNIPAVNAALLTPQTNESGTKQAFIGTEVTAPGFNLDRVGKVTVDEVEAPITEQTIKQIKFRIPALHYPQSDLPYGIKMKVMDRDGKVIFNYDYYVTIPVTDALITGYAPQQGTVGTEIAIVGRNLEQITRVHFGGQKIEAAEFTDLGSSTVKFLVPAGNYPTTETDVDITAEWGENTADVSGSTPFKLSIPAFDALTPQPDGKNSKIGDEIDLTGVNLQLVDSVKWGDYRLTVVEQSQTAMKVKFPASIQKLDPVVQTRALNAYYGKPAQTLGLAAAWRLDTTPTGPATPTATSVTAEDGGADNKFYLAKTVTVEGENLSFVEAIQLQYNDGEDRKIAATILQGASDSELKFTVPDGVTFSTATEVKLVAVYNTTDEADFGAYDVYPFYFFKDVKIGASDPANFAISFFAPDLGRCITTDEWRAHDPYASATVMSAKNTLNKNEVTEAQYYEVLPYFFCVAGSTFSIQGPCGSNSPLKNMRKSDNTSITGGESWYGTPIFGFRNLEFSSAKDEEKAAAAAVRDGSIETMVFTASKIGTSSPTYMETATESNQFQIGSVMLVQYVTYSHGALNPALDAVCRGGFVHVKNVELTASTDKKAIVTFDMYWSKTFNE